MSTLKTNRIENLTTTDGGISIDNSGRVGLGTNSPGSYNAAADNLVIYDSGNAGITIRSGTSSDGAIYFNDTDDANQRGIIRYVHTSDALAFHTSAGESLRIDSSGRVLIGTTDPGYPGYADHFTIGDASDHVGLTLRCPNNKTGQIYFSDTTGTDNAQFDGYIQYDHSVRALVFGAAQSERMRIDSSGRLLINHDADTAPNGYQSKLQLCDTSYQGASISIRRDNGNPPALLFSSSRGTSKGSNTIVQNGDNLGLIDFYGADGTDTNSRAAQIRAEVDGGPGSNDMPGRLVLCTTADGGTDSTERVRITSGGYAKCSNNASYYNSGASYHEFNQSIAAQNTLFNSTLSNYGATQVQFRVSRAGTSNYWFIQGVSGSGSGSEDTEFYIRGDGYAYIDGAWNGGGADYAEYFEWSDGNTETEDRRGISVVLDGNKIREAVEGEEPIGVISGNPSVVGDADVDRWKGKYLRDDFGSYIQEDYEVEDEDGNTVVQQRRKLNPDYNPDTEYVFREDRPEWDCVGLMGKLRIRKGQVTGSRWIKMRDISDSVEEWLVR